jgi:hypothetical protein
MEPHDLKSTPPDDAQLEAWLRANAALPALPDDGFSHRVLTALPAPPRRAALSPRLLAIALGAVAGIGLAALKFATGAPVDFNLPAAGPEFADMLTQLADPKLHTALGVTVVSLAFVFWRDVRRRAGL